jgi:hypothetical protein
MNKSEYQSNFYEDVDEFNYQEFTTETIYYFPNLTEEQLINELYENYYEQIMNCYLRSHFYFYTNKNSNKGKFKELYISHVTSSGCEIASLTENKLQGILSQDFKHYFDSLREINVKNELMNKELDKNTFKNLIHFFNVSIGEYGGSFLTLIKKNNTFILIIFT